MAVTTQKAAKITCMNRSDHVLNAAAKIENRSERAVIKREYSATCRRAQAVFPQGGELVIENSANQVRAGGSPSFLHLQTQLYKPAGSSLTLLLHNPQPMAGL
jgi:hypothetical protein